MAETERARPQPSIAEEALNIERVRACIAARYGGRATGVGLAGRGEWSIAYGFTLDGEPLIVRFGNEREDFEKDRLAAAYASPALPIPRVTEIGDAFGGSCAVSTRLYGAHLDALDASALRTALPALFRARAGQRTPV